MLITLIIVCMGRKRIELRIRQVMDQQGITTAKLAEQADIAYNTALSLRRGVPTRIDLETLARICEVLRTNPGELLELVDDEQNHQQM